jgi:hypothetical protein
MFEDQSRADRILIVPAAALFFLSFALALIVASVAIACLFVSAAAWKLYATCGGQLPRSLRTIAAAFEFAEPQGGLTLYQMLRKGESLKT